MKAKPTSPIADKKKICRDIGGNGTYMGVREVGKETGHRIKDRIFLTKSKNILMKSKLAANATTSGFQPNSGKINARRTWPASIKYIKLKKAQLNLVGLECLLFCSDMM